MSTFDCLDPEQPLLAMPFSTGGDTLLLQSNPIISIGFSAQCAYEVLNWPRKTMGGIMIGGKRYFNFDIGNITPKYMLWSDLIVYRDEEGTIVTEQTGRRGPELALYNPSGDDLIDVTIKFKKEQESRRNTSIQMSKTYIPNAKRRDTPLPGQPGGQTRKEISISNRHSMKVRMKPFMLFKCYIPPGYYATSATLYRGKQYGYQYGSEMEDEVFIDIPDQAENWEYE